MRPTPMRGAYTCLAHERAGPHSTASAQGTHFPLKELIWPVTIILAFSHTVLPRNSQPDGAVEWPAKDAADGPADHPSGYALNQSSIWCSVPSREVYVGP